MINRFTKDIEAMDISLASTIGAFLSCATSAISSMVVVILISPWFVVAAVPLGALYW